MILTNLSPIANHLWQSTIFAAAAGLLTLALKSNRAAVRYWIWISASVKFLIPFSLLVGLGGYFARPAPAVHRPPITLAIRGISDPFIAPAPRPKANAAPPASIGLPEILFGVWLAGVAIGAIAWFRWWLQVRRARRDSTPLDLDLPFPVVSSRSRLEPGVVGILKPVLLLPEGIAERLAPDQLQAVLAHELSHARRRDNLTAAIHMVVEIVFWFHPFVWWIRERLLHERERACDETVLELLPDARVYAQGILNVCKFYLESPLACVAGVTGSNLKKRIEEIMSYRMARNLDTGKKLFLTTAGLGVILAPVAIGFMDGPLRAQAQEHLAFETASVKENKSNDFRNFGVDFLPGGRLTARGVPLLFIVATAYDLPFQSDRLTGGPETLMRTSFDIEATAPPGSIPTDASVKVRNDKIRLMLQSLLADRFKMVIRREVRELPSYAIVVGKNGPKLQKAAIEEKDCDANPGATIPCHRPGGGQGRGIHGDALSISDVANFVSNWTDHPTVDKTGLTGLYKFDTDGWVPMRPRPPRPPGQPVSANAAAEDLAMADPARPTLYQIFDRVGLKLEAQKGPVEMFVIESAQMPTAN